MPGVLMLQTLVEAGAWLLRISEDYAHSVIVLREAKNIKYGNFMEPGKQMLITVELVEKTEELAVFKGKGEMEGQSTVSARITLARYNLRDKNISFKETDEKMITHYKELHRYLSMNS
jgi:3-hydroxyacyl-[acyl-carrier-protein] dehydratase